MSLKRYHLLSLIAVPVLLFAATALAWAGPTASAPGSNTAAPINVGSVSQVKTGGIWASSVGSDSGYCIGASCISSWPVAGATTWLTNGSSIYYSAGKVGVGTSNPNRGLDISTNGGSDGLTIGQDVDNTETIQAYIDGQWAARTTYASGCCNLLKIQPDIGDTQIGPVTIAHDGTISASGVGTLRDAGGGWVRTYGNSGWYSQTYGGGWYMSDATWLRAYGDKNIYTGGSIQAGGFLYNSDQSLKHNINTITDALSTVLKLRGVTFNWNRTGKADVGVIAQEVEKVLPQLVTTDPATGLKSVEYGNLTGVLIEAVKQQQQEITDLKVQQTSLEQRIEALEFARKQ